MDENNINNEFVVESKPVKQLTTNRSLLKLFLLSLVTFGIYPIVAYTKMSMEINTVASKYDGKKTMNYLLMVLLTMFTFGIAAFVWNHKLCTRMDAELKRRNIDYNFNASTFWLWGILGSFIVVGPFVFTHKYIKAMNLLNADYNERG